MFVFGGRNIYNFSFNDLYSYDFGKKKTRRRREKKKKKKRRGKDIYCLQTTELSFFSY